MPKVIFRQEFFDGDRRYKTGEAYDIPEDVVLPKHGIESIDGVEYLPPKRQNFTPNRRRDFRTASKPPVVNAKG